MKCVAHSQDATAICAYCGRALCSACQRVPSSPRVACSEACATALAKTDRAVDSILSKTVETTRRSGYFLLATGLTFVGFAVYGFTESPDMRLSNAWFAAVAVIFLVFGIWNCFLARRREKV
jgi:hypothetical protein